MYVDQSLSLKVTRKNLNNYIKKNEKADNDFKNKQCSQTKFITYRQKHYL